MLGAWPYARGKFGVRDHTKRYHQQYALCECGKKYTRIAYELKKMGEQGCPDCFRFGDREVKGFTYNPFAFLCDLWRLWKGTPEYEQQVHSWAGLKLKLFIERNLEYQDLRKLIHTSGMEGLQLHYAFNKAAR